MTHIEVGGPDEINGNLVTLNALAGVPFSEIRGFRAPYLNYTAEMLTNLANAGFLYDSSATAASPVDANGTDAYWPYTLDNGLANDCLTFDDICSGKPQLPGFWERSPCMPSLTKRELREFISWTLGSMEAMPMSPLG